MRQAFAPLEFSLNNLPRIVQRCLWLFVFLSLLTCTLAAQDEKPVTPLEQGKPIESELAGDAAHSYGIALAANQFLHVVVEQKGIDVVVTLFAADGKKLFEIDSPNGSVGPEPVSIIAETTGNYRLEVRSLEKTAAAGRYEVKIEELRIATEKDRDRLAAEHVLAEAELLRQEGTAKSLRSSIQKYENALLLLRGVGDPGRVATTLNNVGQVYYLLGEFQRALDNFNQALPLFRAVGDRAGEAGILNNSATVYSSLGEKQKALDLFNQAVLLDRAAGDRTGEAASLNNSGLVYSSLGEKQRALDQYTQALPLFRSVGDRTGEAVTLNNIGMVYDDLGEKPKALDYYTQALTIYRVLGDQGNEATTLNNIGTSYDELGEKQKALDVFNQALQLERLVGNQSGEAYTLTNIGAVYDDLSERQKALDYYNQALPLLRKIGDRSGEAGALTNIGVVYVSLGEKQKGIDYFNRALPLRRAVGDRAGESTTLHDIGAVFYSLGEKQKALDYYRQALPLKRAVGDRRGESYTLANIGAVFDSLGKKQEALDYLNQALTLARAVGNRGGQAITLNSIGRLFNSRREKQKALDYYNQALLLRRAVGDRGGEATTLAGIALVERDRGNLNEARARIEAALSIVETLRANIASQELRASYFATVQQYYAFYIDLLMRLHKQQPAAGLDGTALQASERGRARSLLETLAEAGADIRQGVDPILVARERSLQQQLNAKAQAQMSLLNGPHTDAQGETMAKEIEALTSEYQHVEAEIRQRSPNYAALTQPQPLSLKEIQTRVLDADTLLLEYSLGDDHSYVWAVTPNSITSYQLPRREEIETLARSVYALLIDPKRWKSRNADRRRLSSMGKDRQASSSRNDLKRLSQILLSPVAAQLGNKRLVIVADGALQYVPFGALSTPAANGERTQPRSYHPLIIDREIVSLPSASTLAVLRQEVKDRTPAVKTVAVIADPVFESDDERVTKASMVSKSGSANNTPRTQNRELPLGLERTAGESGLRDAKSKIPRLPGTRTEARQILSLVPPEQREEAFDFAASRQAATSDELAQYRHLHFATHGFLNSLHPELSGLVFSMVDEKGNAQDGFLRAHEIFNLRLPAELVVLSACQTGLGKEIKGEGLVGLTRGFMYAGAPRVVVSLWSVSDVATAELMTRFYRGMLKDHLRPATALRAAQVSLMKDKKWESPFYWAAFILQGEWK